jgi:hypothetical protein
MKEKIVVSEVSSWFLRIAQVERIQQGFFWIPDSHFTWAYSHLIRTFTSFRHHESANLILQPIFNNLLYYKHWLGLFSVIDWWGCERKRRLFVLWSVPAFAQIDWFAGYLICRCSLLSSVSEEHLKGPVMSVYRVFPGNLATPWPKFVVEAHCCKNVNRGYCWNTLLQKFEPRLLLEHTVATVWTDVIVGTHCYKSVNRGYCWLTLLEQWRRITLLQQLLWIPLLPLMPLYLLFPWSFCWHQGQWRSVENTFGISVYS